MDGGKGDGSGPSVSLAIYARTDLSRPSCARTHDYCEERTNKKNNYGRILTRRISHRFVFSSTISSRIVPYIFVYSRQNTALLFRAGGTRALRQSMYICLVPYPVLPLPSFQNGL